MSILKSFFFHIIICSSIAFPQWFELDSGISDNLYSVFFIDENLGWAAGKDVILITSDGGSSWSQSPLIGVNNSIYFVTSSVGWVCNSQGKIYKTTNGGINWLLSHTESSKELTSISFLNENLGIASGYNRTILYTSDGGENWQNVLTESYDHLLKTYIYSSGLMLVTGGNGLVYRSYDSGNSWDSLNVGMPNALYGVSFISPLTGFVFGCCGAFFKTTDGGNTWQNHNYITPGDIIYSSNFINDSTGWAVGELGWLLRTTDSGENWFENGPVTDTEFRSVFFVNEEIGFVVGSNGTILKTVNGGGSSTSVSEKGDLTPIAFQLNQNYPNPFNPKTLIGYQLPMSGIVTLKVYNLLGEDVATLVNEEKPAGSYEIAFDASALSSGIYYYRLITESFTETKKMILLR